MWVIQSDTDTRHINHVIIIIATESSSSAIVELGVAVTCANKSCRNKCSQTFFAEEEEEDQDKHESTELLFGEEVEKDSKVREFLE